VKVDDGGGAAALRPTIVDKPSGARRVMHIVEEKVFVALGDDTEKETCRWVLDTGASNHMSLCRVAFSSIDGGTVGTVRFANGSVVKIDGIGTVLYECKNGEHRSLLNVYYIPRLTTNIISVGQLNEDGFDVRIMSLRDENQNLVVRVHRGSGRLYKLDLHIARPVCLATCAGESAWRWHARFGHVNFASLRKMASAGLVRGLPTLEHVEQVCEACIARKHRRAPFPQQASRRATKSLELLHGCGPVSPPTPRGNQYFLLLVDDYSHYTWVSLIASKDQAASEIKRMQPAAERKSGNLLCALRTYRGGEFTAAQFKEYCDELSVFRELTAPYSPQQNGVVERRNQSVMAAARCMLKAKKLSGIFWGEAVNYVVYLLNRHCLKALEIRHPMSCGHGVSQL
jgi:hypothetical protein